MRNKKCQNLHRVGAAGVANYLAHSEMGSKGAVVL